MRLLFVLEKKLPKYLVTIETIFTVDGESVDAVDSFVKDNFFTADIDSDELPNEKESYNIVIKEY
jgi:hypothetical protein